MLHIGDFPNHRKGLLRPRQNKQKSVLTDLDDDVPEYATERDGTRIFPVSRHAYIDTLVFVLPRQGLSQREHEWLDRQQRRSIEWKRNPWRREQELWLYYPISDEVIAFMIELMRRYPELRHRRTDVALDLCFNSQEEKEQARKSWNDHNVMKHCREVPYTERHGTTYNKRKEKPNNRATYDYSSCRVTGEPYCLHIEARHKGRLTLERNGTDIENIMKLDLYVFWQKNLRMAKLDIPRLGRTEDNREKGQARRKSNIKRRGEFVYDSDKLKGHLLVREHVAINGYTTQGAIIKLREKGIDVLRRNCLVDIEVEQMLPLREECGERVKDKTYILKRARG